VFSLIQTNEVRWIFVTHDDCDHTGNLVEALKRCPNAMVVTNKAASWRTAAAFGIPHERIRTVNNGETFNLGDRTFRAIRPPVFDSPYTLGLFDTTTRVYYASDAFCSPMPIDPVDLVDEMPALFWAEGMAKYHHTSLCPWIALVDPAKFQAEINKVVGLGIKAVAGAHTPVIPETSVQQAFGLLASVPFNVAPPLNLDGVGVSLVTPSSET
jgi:flavorubredoxin